MLTQLQTLLWTVVMRFLEQYVEDHPYQDFDTETALVYNENTLYTEVMQLI